MKQFLIKLKKVSNYLLFLSFYLLIYYIYIYETDRKKELSFSKKLERIDIMKDYEKEELKLTRDTIEAMHSFVLSAASNYSTRCIDLWRGLNYRDADMILAMLEMQVSDDELKTLYRTFNAEYHISRTPKRHCAEKGITNLTTNERVGLVRLLTPGLKVNDLQKRCDMVWEKLTLEEASKLLKIMDAIVSDEEKVIIHNSFNSFYTFINTEDKSKTSDKGFHKNIGSHIR